MKSRKSGRRKKTTSKESARRSQTIYAKARTGRFVAEPKPVVRRRVATPETREDPLSPEERVKRSRQAAALLRKWMADDSGYDEEVWPAVEQVLKEDPIRFRESF